VQAHEGRAPAALPGTLPTAPLAQAPPAPPERASDRPILPLERIEPEFVERVLGIDNAAPAPRAAKRNIDAPPGQSSWTDTLRRWIGG
jgi:hypothetical protein